MNYGVKLFMHLGCLKSRIFRSCFVRIPREYYTGYEKFSTFSNPFRAACRFKKSNIFLLCTFRCSSTSVGELNLNNAAVQKYLSRLISQFETVEKKIPTVTDAQERRQLVKTLMELSPVVSMAEEASKLTGEIKDLELLIEELSEKEQEKDKEMLIFAKEEKEKSCQRFAELEASVIEVLSPKDIVDEKDLVLELTAGVGGQEAMLFTNDIFNMYYNYAIWKGWNCDILNLEETDLGGVRHVCLSICGKNAFKYLKFESGVHRVQRVPKTEKSGRIHTSTMTVSVIPQPSEIDVVLDPKDLVIENKHSSGPGGQHANKSLTCVTITHIPTGFKAKSQQHRQQHRNKELAMQVLRARIFQNQLEQQLNETRSSKKSQIGTAARSDKVRTYNFPQNRITDHRSNIHLHNLEEFLLGREKLDEVIEEMLKITKHEAFLDMLTQHET